VETTGSVNRHTQVRTSARRHRRVSLHLLALDAHSVSSERDARARVRHSVHDHEALKADPHPAVDATRRASRGAPRHKSCVGDEHRGDRLSVITTHRTTVEHDLQRLASSERATRLQHKTTTRSEHPAMLAPRPRRSR
jgi:hypothetical protein